MTDRLAYDKTHVGIGATIAGRYRLVGHLGDGGMGQVFEAEHLALGRHFALKILRVERLSNEQVARFRREAQALARLSTPYIAQVTDFGVSDDAGPYYVMELVAGETLQHRLERGPLAVDEAVRVATATADALAEVHAAGLVHRDLKPSNMALPASGPIHVKLLDFGLAAAIDDAFLERLTKSQQVLGSLPYMPPEAFSGARPSASMDLYALGVVLYQSLSGTLPFFASSTAAFIHQVLASPVPPLAHRAPHVPTSVARVVERLLAKDPDDRFRDATEVAQALSTLEKAPPMSRHPSSVPPTMMSEPPPAAAITMPSAQPVPAQPSVSTFEAAGPSRSFAPTAQPATSIGLLLGAVAIGFVLAGVAALLVVSLLDLRPSASNSARGNGDQRPPTAATAPIPVVLGTGRDEITVDTTNKDADLREPEQSSEEEPPAERDQRVEPEVEPSMRRRSSVRAQAPSPSRPPEAPVTAMTAAPMRAMRGPWHGQGAIVDDSEFD